MPVCGAGKCIIIIDVMRKYFLIQQIYLCFLFLYLGQGCFYAELPLEGRHFCGICRNTQLHGPCGEYLGNDDEVTYRNSCLYCAIRRKELKDLGVSQEEIDLMLPLPIN